jgi:hypothetical protein
MNEGELCWPKKLELELIQTQMTQKQTLRAETYARALRAIQNMKKAEVWARDAPDGRRGVGECGSGRHSHGVA